MAFKRTNTRMLASNKLFKHYFTLHRHRVENAQPEIDDKPPPLNSHLFSKLGHIKEKCVGMRKRLHENTELLKRINEMLKNYSMKDKYNEGFNKTSSKIPLKVKRLHEIEKNNLKLAFRLVNAKSVVNTNLTKLKHSLKSERYAVPNHVLDYYKDVVSPDMQYFVHTLLRPRIYFDLEIRGMYPLGRIVMQLFTEACPDVVMEFVRLCHEKDTSDFRVMRVFPELWIDGELKLHDQKLENPGFVYDITAFQNHTKSGILSFSQKYLNEGFANGCLNFTITFEPLTKVNNERLQFGVVTEGLRWLSCIRDFGTKGGKTKKTIGLLGCGLLNN